jgi:probable F420-dependent oxidoreductase
VTGQDPRSRLRARLGQWGIAHTGLNALPAGAVVEAVRELEQRGVRTLWISDSVRGRDPFVLAGLMLNATTELTVALGVANIYGRDPATMQIAACTVAEAYCGRFVLGLGVSHQPTLAQRGHVSGRPIETMSAYLEAMDRVDYLPPAPLEPVARLVGALGPRMLELAARRTDGVHPYLVTPRHTAQARALIGNTLFLGPEQTVLIEGDPERARSVARAHLMAYLSMPNYRRSVLAQGFEDEDLAGGGSDRLVDALVLWGDAESVVERAEEQCAAGADHVALLPIGASPREIGSGVLSLAELLAAAQP